MGPVARISMLWAFRRGFNESYVMRGSNGELIKGKELWSAGVLDRKHPKADHPFFPKLHHS
jgi:hypothetical protein